MTLRNNMTKQQRNAKVDQGMQQLQMATQISQMMLQQIGRNVTAMQKDIGELAARQRELQYRTLALQELAGLSLDAINKKAEELQVRDFDSYSLKDDEQKGLTTVEEIAEDSIVIFTTTASENRGYLRSKQALSELAFPALKEGLLGKRVGDKVDADINGVTHTVTVLGIRKKPEGASDEQQEDGQEMSAEA